MSLENSGGSQKNLLSSMTYSQIWLSPLVDDHWSTYLTEVKKKSLTPTLSKYK